jgi:hypothetical protein
MKLLDDSRSAESINAGLSELANVNSYEEFNRIERNTASVYWRSWISRVHIRWEANETRIPHNWLTFPKRKSSANTTQRGANDPINAMLNYGYSIGYAESSIACIANALNPSLGYMHLDTDSRESLSLDLLETIRPEIDAFILDDLINKREFTWKDFKEPRDDSHGVVRLVAPLTHEIAEQSSKWQESLCEAARQMVNILGAPIGVTGRRYSTLNQQRDEFISQAVSIDAILPMDIWISKFAPVLPRNKNASIPNRTIIAAMIYLARHGRPWAHVPTGFGISTRTLTGRRQDWRQLGIWETIQSLISEMNT